MSFDHHDGLGHLKTLKAFFEFDFDSSAWPAHHPPGAAEPCSVSSALSQCLAELEQLQTDMQSEHGQLAAAQYVHELRHLVALYVGMVDANKVDPSWLLDKPCDGVCARLLRAACRPVVQASSANATPLHR